MVLPLQVVSIGERAWEVGVQMQTLRINDHHLAIKQKTSFLVAYLLSVSS